ncbi:hypothetical protein QJS04_geneDACA021980 [Acorus gramineus]|uniref:Wound-responsive family protein n=1 Tax=Acorus gramineus TaxID=55184 RepID=A0AAV9AA74_ACOGR|nr:hypothetical protein QJS04_geneDACA021980 [Acorus gramineus]
MSSTSRVWVRATSLGTVEALKDQLGFCRWNHAFRSIQQEAKKSIRSHYQAKPNTSSSSSEVSSVAVVGRRRRDGDEKARGSEEALRKVMYLSCWGPN